jgi:hypothetical protein
MSAPGNEISYHHVTVVADRIWRCRSVAADSTGTSIDSLRFEITLNEAKHEIHTNTELRPRVLRRPLEVGSKLLAKRSNDPRMVNRHFTAKSAA